MSSRLAVGGFRVQRMAMPDGSESFTVLDPAGDVVGAAEAFLAHLQALDRSPLTVRTYAFTLTLWFEFLSIVGASWDTAKAEHVSRFVAWLRAPAINVVVLPSGTASRTASTVNKHLAGLFSFYDFHARNGVVLADALVRWRRSNRGGYKPFLTHVTSGRPAPTRPLRLRQPTRLPRTLTREQVISVVEACDHLRDRFLLVLLAETGMRIGQALGLRHSDFVSHEKTLHIVPRGDNANGARAKTIETTVLPVSTGLVRLYSAYMFEEYGDLDSDYVFVNLFACPYGEAMTYAAVEKLVGRLRDRTGVEFTLHMLRHSRASDWLRSGVGLDIVSRLLTHRSPETTSKTYGHLDAEDLRRELVRAGAWKEDQ